MYYSGKNRRLGGVEVHNTCRVVNNT
jgi:hypothetical protein